MKTFLKLMALFLFMASLQNCAEDEPLRPEKVQFTFALSDTDSGGGRIKADLPAGTQLVISLTTTSGTPVLTNHKINLLTFGGGIITEPVELAPNHYIVTDFMLVNNGQVLYVTPRKGSALAVSVINPLPFGFTVLKNKITNIEMEVMDAKQHAPEDFGYASFNINIKSAFQLSVFTTSGGQPVLTSASVVLLQGGPLQGPAELIASWNVDAKINLLSFGGNTKQEYTLLIEKDGHVPYTRTFYISDLLSEIGNLPLKVILEPKMDMVVHSTEQNYGFQLLVMGDERARLTINWGDGTTETVGLSDEPEALISHQYSRLGNFNVTVTGDLHEIKNISTVYNFTALGYINLRHLTELTGFSGVWTSGPRVLNLSHNPKITSITMINVEDLQEIVLPANHKITRISVPGPNLLDATDIDALIANIYHNATTQNLRNGYIGLDASWDQNHYPPEDLTMVGPPSAESMAKLKTLKFDYGWTISPDPWD